MMQVRILLLILFNLICFSSYVYAENLVSYVDEIKVYFSPRGGAQQAIVQAIDGAKNEIRVMAYSFTAEPIARSLIRAHARGVDVITIVDKSQIKAKGGRMQALIDNGLAVYVDRRHAIAHNKVIIIDEHCTITGSYNFSKAAEERNAENVLIIDGKQLAQKYLQNFAKHLQHATRPNNVD